MCRSWPAASPTTRARGRAIHAGAKEYIPLPPDPELIAAVLAAVADDSREMIYRDDAMAAVVKLAQQIAGSDASVLITGESGTGKEVLARYLHARSQRAKKPFITVNCAAIPENLLESELFGHEKGAFTGAVARRIGKFEEANGGTLLLDEISEMDVRLQAKLLRAIQERVIDRVGGGKPVPVDIRIVATSNRNLTDAVREGKFREDLLFRLNVVNLKDPAVARAAGRHRRAGAVFRQEIFRRPTACRCARCRRKRAARSTSTAGRAMCANWRTRCTAPCCSRPARRSASTGFCRPTARGSTSARHSGAAAQAAMAAEQVTRNLVGRTVAEVERDLILETLKHLPGQPHPRRQYPRHLDPHAAQQAQRICRRRRADPAAEWRRSCAARRRKLVAGMPSRRSFSASPVTQIAPRELRPYRDGGQ